MTNFLTEKCFVSKLKKNLIFFILTIFSGLIFGSGGISKYITFQGKLTNNLGEVLDGSYDINIRFYDVASGGSPVWNYEVTSVSVESGLYSIEISTEAVFDKEYWVEIGVRATLGGNYEYFPRYRLTSTPYSFRSKYAETADFATNVGNLNLSAGISSTFGVFTGSVTANKFYGDGSGLTGIVASTTNAQQLIGIPASISPEPGAVRFVPLDTSGNNQANTVATYSIRDNAVTPVKVSTGTFEHIRAGTATVSYLLSGRPVEYFAVFNDVQGSTSALKNYIDLVAISTGTLVKKAGDTMTGSLTFSGVASDITTLSNEHLALMPNGSGKVGIGIVNPTHLLHVNGAILAVSSITATGGFYGDGSGLTNVSGVDEQVRVSTGNINNDLQGFKILIGQSTGTLVNVDILIGQSTGTLKNELNEVKVSTGWLVTLDTDQTITAVKTFSSSVTITSADGLRVAGLRVISNQVNKFDNNGDLRLYSGTDSSDGGAIELYGAGSGVVEGNRGRARILITQGGKGFDIMRGGDWTTLLTVSTSGVLGLNDNIRGFNVSVGHDTSSTTVTIAHQPDANYAVIITPNWGVDTVGNPISFWVKDKQTNQFGVYYSSAPASVGTKSFDWLIIR